jgi:hypothetical protein
MRFEALTVNDEVYNDLQLCDAVWCRFVCSLFNDDCSVTQTTSRRMKGR